MKKARKTLNAIGLRYTIFAIVVLAVQRISVIFLNQFFPGAILKERVLVQLGLTVLSIYVVGFPLIWILLRGQQSFERPDGKLTVGRFLIGIPKCFTINLLGAFIGAMVNFLITGGFESNIEDLLLSEEHRFFTILVVGICAPVFEELIFRKLLIDHLAYRGRWLAIITSGLLFGLYHGNFTQCFYAAGLGMFFAYIYVTTGKIRYTIAYHMLINLQSTIISFVVLSRYNEEAAAGRMGIGYFALILYGIFVLVLAVIGFVFWILDIVRGRSIEVYEEGETVRNGGALKAFLSSWGIWLFLLMCAYEFVSYYRAIL